MKKLKRFGRMHVVLVFCLIIVVGLSGCATIGQGIGGLFSGIGQIVGGVLKLAGKALDFASKLPKPPPGVF